MSVMTGSRRSGVHEWSLRCVCVCVCGVRSEGEDEDDSLAGTKVRVKYGRGKTQKIYEAHIKKTDVDNGEQFYLVHYYGWNVRLVWPRRHRPALRRRSLSL